MAAMSKQAVVAGLVSVIVLILTMTGRKAPAPSAEKKNKIAINYLFFKRIGILWGICLPRFSSVESLLMLTLGLLLFLRTNLTLVMASVVGGNAKSLVNRDLKQFIFGVADIGLWAFPSSVVNSGIRYVTSLLEQRFRANLQHFLHKQYLAESNAYTIATQGKATIDNPDHRMTQDALQFCTELTDIFPSVFKPLFDVFTFILQLSRHGGFLPPAVLISYYLFSGSVLRTIMPNNAKLTAQSQQKEGDFRTIHAQIIQHAEEVAFYRGESTERDNANHYIEKVVRHQLFVKKMKSVTDFLDAVLIKYGATCVGYAVCSIGVFELSGKVPASELTRVYVQSSQLYIPLARAIGKLIMLHKKITTLGGCTHRVGELVEAFAGLKSVAETQVLEQPRGNTIELVNADICTPDGTVLIRSLSLVIERQKHLLIMGNNGSGKSALVRTLAGLWHLQSGTFVRPPLQTLMFLPQRVYLPVGTLRQQLIYPQLDGDTESGCVSDTEIIAMAADVGLSSVIEREGGLNAEKNWHDVLSGGERQRVAIVRVLFHRPNFVLLDECTSAVSQDIEPDLYVQMKRRGVSLVTISHRESLAAHHDMILSLEGTGSYKLMEIKH